MQQHVGEAVVGELEVPLVVELEQSRTVRVVLLEVDVVDLGLVGRVTALFAHVHLAGGGKKEGKLSCHAGNVVVVQVVDSAPGSELHE